MLKDGAINNSCPTPLSVTLFKKTTTKTVRITGPWRHRLFVQKYSMKADSKNLYSFFKWHAGNFWPRIFGTRKRRWKVGYGFVLNIFLSDGPITYTMSEFRSTSDNIKQSRQRHTMNIRVIRHTCIVRVYCNLSEPYWQSDTTAQWGWALATNSNWGEFKHCSPSFGANSSLLPSPNLHFPPLSSVLLPVKSSFEGLRSVVSFPMTAKHFCIFGAKKMCRMAIILVLSAGTKAVPRLSISCFVPKIFAAAKVAVKLRSRRKTSKTCSFGGSNYCARENPKFWTCTFKSGSLPNICQVLHDWIPFSKLRETAIAKQKELEMWQL